MEATAPTAATSASSSSAAVAPSSVFIIGAVELLLGLRSAGEMLRSGAEEGRVSGVFDVSPAVLKSVTWLLQAFFLPFVIIPLLAVAFAVLGWVFLVHGVASSVHDFTAS